MTEKSDTTLMSLLGAIDLALWGLLLFGFVPYLLLRATNMFQTSPVSLGDKAYVYGLALLWALMWMRTLREGWRSLMTGQPTVWERYSQE